MESRREAWADSGSSENEVYREKGESERMFFTEIKGSDVSEICSIVLYLNLGPQRLCGEVA